jgi:hypothetical protein
MGATLPVPSVNREIGKEKDFPFSILDMTFVIVPKSPNVYWDAAGSPSAMSNDKSHMENGKSISSSIS